MGLAVCGMVFQRQSGIFEPDKIISTLFGEQFRRLSQPSDSFDIRRDEFISIELIDNTCFVYSSALTNQFVFNQSEDISGIYNALEMPELILAFCHLDSGGSYGYVFFENGKKTRLRLFSDEKLIEEGNPKPFELEWINAETYIENPDDPPEEHQKIYFKNNHQTQVSEYSLTGRLLYEALQKYFKVYPWEEDLPNSKRFYYSKIVNIEASSTNQNTNMHKNETPTLSSLVPSGLGIIAAAVAFIIKRRNKAKNDS